jgi:hypothetical protein
MITHDISSRLMYIQGEATLNKSYSGENDAEPVNLGRCIYAVRLELAPRGHPEITEDRFDLDVRTTWNGVYWQKGVGGGKRGPSENQVTFKELTKNIQTPTERANKSVPEGMREALTEILGEDVFNCNARIYSEFDGTWRYFQDRSLGCFHCDNRFNKLKTYLPIVIQACQEDLI